MISPTIQNKMTIVEGDTTGLDVDAIVNAANQTLLGGGGVDGAIHQAAGQGLLKECWALGGCPTGEARINAGHNLSPRYVTHTVGPVWQGGVQGKEKLLRGCYWNSLTLAGEHGLACIAFPAISTGVYRFPTDLAARIAVAIVADFLAGADGVEKVIFCCFGEASVDAHIAAMA